MVFTRADALLRQMHVQSQLEMVAEDMRVAKDQEQPLIVFMPLSKRQDGRRTNVLVFDPTWDALKVDSALSLWRHWSLVAEKTGIERAVQDSSMAMEFQKLE